MFNVGDTVRISPISMIINPQGYQKFKDTTGTVVDVGFMKSLVEFKDTTYYPYECEWFYDIQLKHFAKLTKSEKFIFTHTNYTYCTSNISDIYTVIKFDNNYEDVISFISECNKYADTSQQSFIIFNDYINDDIHNEIDKTRFSIKINKNYVDVIQSNCIVFNLETSKLDVYSEDTFNKMFRLIDKIYPINYD